MSHPPSPSSVRWHYGPDNYYKEEKPTTVHPSIIPSEQEMERRFKIRRMIHEETLRQRQVHVPSSSSSFCQQNICHTLYQRSLGKHTTKHVRIFGEYASVTKYQPAFLSHLGGDDEIVNGKRSSSSKAVSTISIAFSPSGQTMASTHGDHTVKISACASGHLLRTLEGHPRTPWTCKYHPFREDIVASGCLGHQVRLWNWKSDVCLAMVRLEFAIISLSFHPTGQLLAIANGTRLHFWGLQDSLDENNNKMSNINNSTSTTNRDRLTELEQRHMLRCVHFPPDGNTIIVGGVNLTDAMAGNQRRRGGISGGGMSFYLRLWDFDIQTALENGRSLGIRHRPISNPRTFLPRALLYNDGGFDVSPDGKTLCACAEYWLPEGVNNAMDLLASLKDDDDDDPHVDENDRASVTKQLSLSTSSRGNTSPIQKQKKTLTPIAGSMIHSPSRNAPLSRIRPPYQKALKQSVSSPAPPPQQRFRNEEIPQTPPPNQTNLTLSPPSPPGRRFAGGLNNDTHAEVPGPPGIRDNGEDMGVRGRYVPHVVTISLDTSIDSETTSNHDFLQPPHHPNSYFNKKQKLLTKEQKRPRLGQLLQACPLDGKKASAVTCVKFSPSTHFCLIGYGVREPIMTGDIPLHPVTAMYSTVGKMTHISTMLSSDDDVNIARFHPNSGMGFCYGTKQGRVRVLGPRPWNYYNC